MSFWFVFRLSCCNLPRLQPFIRHFGISVPSHSLRLAASAGDQASAPSEAPEAQDGQRHGTEVMPSCSDPRWGNG